MKNSKPVSRQKSETSNLTDGRQDCVAELFITVEGRMRSADKDRLVAYERIIGIIGQIAEVERLSNHGPAAINRLIANPDRDSIVGVGVFPETVTDIDHACLFDVADPGNADAFAVGRVGDGIGAVVIDVADPEIVKPGFDQNNDPVVDGGAEGSRVGTIYGEAAQAEAIIAARIALPDDLVVLREDTSRQGDHQTEEHEEKRDHATGNTHRFAPPGQRHLFDSFAR